MLIEFSGKRVFISASTGGIGFAVAQGFLAAGASVIINGRSEAGVRSAVERLKKGGADAAGVAADLGEHDGLVRLVAGEPDFDIVVSNLGAFPNGDFFDTGDETWEAVFQSNVMSGVRLARAYARGMAVRGWGRIVFISSESAINVPVDAIPYGVTKAALLALSRGLAKRLAGTGVTVNAVLPGPTLSEGMAAALKPAMGRSGESLEKAATAFVSEQRPSSIIRRAATVEEVASMVLYACSEQASATTGAALRVDGGVVETIF